MKKLEKPASFITANSGKNLGWNAVTGANHYVISVAGGGIWSVNNCQFDTTDATLPMRFVDGRTYDVTVVACNGNPSQNSKPATVKISIAGGIITIVPPPPATASTFGMKLAWVLGILAFLLLALLLFRSYGCGDECKKLWKFTTGNNGALGMQSLGDHNTYGDNAMIQLNQTVLNGIVLPCQIEKKEAVWVDRKDIIPPKEPICMACATTTVVRPPAEQMTRYVVIQPEPQRFFAPSQPNIIYWGNQYQSDTHFMNAWNPPPLCTTPLWTPNCGTKYRLKCWK